MFTMQVTCSCGKKHFFGDDPDEEQVCDRCGQTVRASGGDDRAERRGPKRRASGLRTAVPRRETGELRKTPVPPRISTRARLFIASERVSKKGCGCVIFLLVIVGGVLGADHFLNPPELLPCAHEGRTSYVFGVLPLGHECEGLKALKYLDRARLALASSRGRPSDFANVKSLPGVGEPPEGTPYGFNIFGESVLAADPKDPESSLFHYLMEPDGTVRFEKDGQATRQSAKSGSIAP